MGGAVSKRQSYSPGDGKYATQVATAVPENGDIKAGANGQVEFVPKGDPAEQNDVIAADDSASVTPTPSVPATPNASSPAAADKKTKRRTPRFVFSLKRTGSGKRSRKPRTEANGVRPTSYPGPASGSAAQPDAGKGRPQSLFLEEIAIPEDDGKIETVSLSSNDDHKDQDKTKDPSSPSQPSSPTGKKDKKKDGSQKKKNSKKKKDKESKSKAEKQKKGETEKEPQREQAPKETKVVVEEVVSPVEASTELQTPKPPTEETKQEKPAEITAVEVKAEDGKSNEAETKETPTEGVEPKVELEIETAVKPVVEEQIEVVPTESVESKVELEIETAVKPVVEKQIEVVPTEGVEPEAELEIETAVKPFVEEQIEVVIEPKIAAVAQAEIKKEQQDLPEKEPEAITAATEIIFQQPETKANLTEPVTTVSEMILQQPETKAEPTEPIVADTEVILQQPETKLELNESIVADTEVILQQPETKPELSEPIAAVTEMISQQTEAKLELTVSGAEHNKDSDDRKEPDVTPAQAENFEAVTDTTQKQEEVQEVIEPDNIIKPTVVSNEVTEFAQKTPAEPSETQVIDVISDDNIKDADDKTEGADVKVEGAGDLVEETVAVQVQAALQAVQPETKEETVQCQVEPSVQLPEVSASVPSNTESQNNESPESLPDTPTEKETTAAELAQAAAATVAGVGITKPAEPATESDSRPAENTPHGEPLSPTQLKALGKEIKANKKKEEKEKAKREKEEKKRLKELKKKEAKEKKQKEKEERDRRLREEKARTLAAVETRQAGTAQGAVEGALSASNSLPAQYVPTVPITAQVKSEAAGEDVSASDKGTDSALNVSITGQAKPESLVGIQPSIPNVDPGNDKNTQAQVDIPELPELSTGIISLENNSQDSPADGMVSGNDPHAVKIETEMPNPAAVLRREDNSSQDNPVKEVCSSVENVTVEVQPNASLEPLQTPETPTQDTPAGSECSSPSVSTVSSPLSPTTPTTPFGEDQPSDVVLSGESGPGSPVSPETGESARSGALRKIELGPRLRTAILRKSSSGAESGEMRVSLTQPKHVQVSELTPPPRKQRPRKPVEQVWNPLENCISGPRSPRSPKQIEARAVVEETVNVVTVSQSESSPGSSKEGVAVVPQLGKEEITDKELTASSSSASGPSPPEDSNKTSENESLSLEQVEGEIEEHLTAASCVSVQSVPPDSLPLDLREVSSRNLDASGKEGTAFVFSSSVPQPACSQTSGDDCTLEADAAKTTEDDTGYKVMVDLPSPGSRASIHSDPASPTVVSVASIVLAAQEEISDTVPTADPPHQLPERDREEEKEGDESGKEEQEVQATYAVTVQAETKEGALQNMVAEMVSQAHKDAQEEAAMLVSEELGNRQNQNVDTAEARSEDTNTEHDGMDTAVYVHSESVPKADLKCLVLGDGETNKAGDSTPETRCEDNVDADNELTDDKFDAKCEEADDDNDKKTIHCDVVVDAGIINVVQTQAAAMQRENKDSESSELAATEAVQAILSVSSTSEGVKTQSLNSSLHETGLEEAATEGSVELLDSSLSATTEDTSERSDNTENVSGSICGVELKPDLGIGISDGKAEAVTTEDKQTLALENEAETESAADTASTTDERKNEAPAAAQSDNTATGGNTLHLDCLKDYSFTVVAGGQDGETPSVKETEVAVEVKTKSEDGQRNEASRDQQGTEPPATEEFTSEQGDGPYSVETNRTEESPNSGKNSSSPEATASPHSGSLSENCEQLLNGEEKREKIEGGDGKDEAEKDEVKITACCNGSSKPKTDSNDTIDAYLRVQGGPTESKAVVDKLEMNNTCGGNEEIAEQTASATHTDSIE